MTFEEREAIKQACREAVREELRNLYGVPAPASQNGLIELARINPQASIAEAKRLSKLARRKA